MKTRLSALFLMSVAASAAWAQAPTPPTPQKPAASEQTTPAGLGFSIESEMLTYKSLEANSEAVACDLARFLYNSASGAPTANAPCTIQTGTNGNIGVVIISSNSTILTDFQIWRSDMAAMGALELQAAKFCPAQPKTRGPVTSAAAAAGPMGEALPLAQSVLGLFAAQRSLSSVGGTIQDQALMNGIARQLKALNISVLIPEIYRPFALEGTDYTQSPFLAGIAKLMDARACLQTKKEASAKDTQQGQPSADDISGVISAIDLYINAVMGGAPVQQTAAAHPSPTAGTQEAAAAATSPHLASVLAADGLARAIGMRSDGTQSPDSIWRHILWVKALESGGSVERSGNFFKNSVRFSGGGVSTYALFDFDGTLACSGNVYDYQGSFLTKQFERSFREPITDPNTPLSMARGSCGPSK